MSRSETIHSSDRTNRRRYVLLICSALVAALLTAETSAAIPGVGLQGVDRLYFEHVGGPGERLAVPSYVAGLLPEELPPAEPSRSRGTDQETDAKVRDFRLPLERVPQELTLRQIVNGGESGRITELWWALYDGGRRSDVWYYRADPARSEDKTLPNYEIEAASASVEDGVELRVRGTMFRPQGAWSITGKIFTFSMRDEKLTLLRVRNAFGFFRDYDRGASAPSIDVSTEHEVSGRFETLKYESVPVAALRACRFRDPLSDENWGFSWAGMEKAAECVTEKSKARPSYRGLDEPSFVERGGRAK